MALAEANLNSRAITGMMVPYSVRQNDCDKLIDGMARWEGKERILEVLKAARVPIAALAAAGVEDIPETVFSVTSYSQDATQMAGHSTLMHEILDSIQDGDEIGDKWQQMFENVPACNDAALLAELCTKSNFLQSGNTKNGPKGNIYYFTNQLDSTTVSVEAASLKSACEYLLDRVENVRTATEAIDNIGSNYEIVREAVATEELPSDLEVYPYINQLENHRTFRRLCGKKGTFKMLMSPDNSSKGTHWKFRPMYLDMLANGNFKKKITALLIGTGPHGHNGMLTEFERVFAGYDLEIYCFDPDMVLTSYPLAEKDHLISNCSSYDVSNQVHKMKFNLFDCFFEPLSKKHAEIMDMCDLVVSDAALSEHQSFSGTMAKEMTCKLINLFEKSKKAQFLISKLDMMDLRDVPCKKAYFGRGHNHESFVFLDRNTEHRFISTEKLLEVYEKKKKCSQVRNIKVIDPRAHFECSTPCEDITALPPYNGHAPQLRGTYARKRTMLTVGQVAGIIGEVPYDNRTPGNAFVNGLLVIAQLCPEIPADALGPVHSAVIDTFMKSVLDKKGRHLYGNKRQSDAKQREKQHAVKRHLRQAGSDQINRLQKGEEHPADIFPPGTAPESNKKRNNVKKKNKKKTKTESAQIEEEEEEDIHVEVGEDLDAEVEEEIVETIAEVILNEELNDGKMSIVSEQDIESASAEKLVMKSTRDMIVSCLEKDKVNRKERKKKTKKN